MTELETRAQGILEQFAERDLDFGYTLGPAIAAGGMASVHKAQNFAGAQFAAKLPLTIKTKWVLRLERERQALGLFDEDCICKLADYGMMARKPALVLEWIEGVNLLDVIGQMRILGLDRRQKLSLVTLLVHRLCRPVALVHGKGLVHRDIKPENLMLLADGTAKLIDFGVVAPLPEVVATSGRPAITKLSITQDEVPGTPLYMAPEQFGNAEPKPSADIYGLGSVIYFMITGQAAFADAHTELALISRKTSRDFPNPRRDSDFCPSWLAEIVRRATLAVPEDRPKSVTEILDEVPKEERAANELLKTIIAKLLGS